MANKVLIFGAKGVLGRELVKVFEEGGYTVVGWDKEDVDLVSSDLAGKINEVHPDIIINASGYNKVDLAETDPSEKETAFAVNAQAPKIMAETAKQLDIIFINYSTDYVFDGLKGSAYSEADEPNPQTEYGKSKLEGEKNIISIGGKYYIIRPSRIFGRPGHGGAKKSFVEIMLEKKDQPEIKVVSDERGSPTYAPDLAHFTLNLVADSAPFGVYHGTNSGSCSWYEWAEEIFLLAGVQPKLIAVSGAEFGAPAKRPPDSTLVNTKTKPQRSWKEALKEYFQTK